jgi:hypothetical protein
METSQLILTVRRLQRAATVCIVAVSSILSAQSQFSGVWSGAFTPGIPFVLEIGASGDVARLTYSGYAPEVLRFIGYNPSVPAVNFWREQDHAAISVYATGAGVQFSYLEESFLRTTTLVLQAPFAGNIGAGSPAVPTTTSRFVGRWSGTLTPGGPTMTINIAPGNLATGVANGITFNLDYVGYNPSVPSICFWVPHDHGFLFLFAAGSGTSMAYLEEGFLRTATLQLESDDCAELQRALNDALAALAAANGQVASLQQQLAACAVERDAALAHVSTLQGQLATATAQIAVLSSQVTNLQQQLAAANGVIDSVESSLAAIEAEIRQEIGVPTFRIPGNSTAERMQALARAVIDLNRGRTQGIYDGLR